MSRATYYVGDALKVMRGLPDGSVDLVLTSPPFLGQRSYLPNDHPSKGDEVGQEPDPATFVDVLLEHTAEWRRLLAPHGSIMVELGDKYAGVYPHSGVSHRKRTIPKGRNVSGASHQSGLRTRRRVEGWPAAKSAALIPELYRIFDTVRIDWHMTISDPENWPNLAHQAWKPAKQDNEPPISNQLHINGALIAIAVSTIPTPDPKLTIWPRPPIRKISMATGEIVDQAQAVLLTSDDAPTWEAIIVPYTKS